MIPEFVNALQDTKPQAGITEAVSQLGYTSSPTNEQIVEGSKAAYNEYKATVDAMTLALVNTLKDPAMTDAVAKLDSTNWSSLGIYASLVDPLFNGNDLKTARNVARKSTNLHSLTIGVFSNSVPPPAHGSGMIGFGREIAGSGVSGVVLQLDIFSKIVSIDNTNNLQFGVWLPLPSQLHDSVTGLYINTSVRSISLNLIILLTKSLQPYGFAVSSGAHLILPVSSGAFAGSTSVWMTV